MPLVLMQLRLRLRLQLQLQLQLQLLPSCQVATQLHRGQRRRSYQPSVLSDYMTDNGLFERKV